MCICISTSHKGQIFSGGEDDPDPHCLAGAVVRARGGQPIFPTALQRRKDAVSPAVLLQVFRYSRSKYLSPSGDSVRLSE
jgi:hypothetical protein